MQGEINSRRNNIIKMCVKLINSPRERKEQNKFIVEGTKLCLDAVKSGIKIDTFLYTNKALTKNNYISEFIKSSKNSYIIPEDLFDYISDTKTAQGVMFICEKPCINNGLDIIGNNSAIALETIQDPRNLGAILRTAEAFNIINIILTDDCCDYLSPKTIRASMGAVFKVNIIFVNSLQNVISKLKNKGFNVYASVLNSEAKNIKQIKLKKPCVTVIGNEGNGLNKETINACNNSIYIPMQGNAQSLNVAVATGILMWEMTR